MPPQMLREDSDSDVGDLPNETPELQAENEKSAPQSDNETEQQDEETAPQPVKGAARSVDDEDEADEEGGEDEEGLYQVETIRGHKIQAKKVLYEIKWAGYKETDNTWEPEENLLPDAQDLLDNYHKKIGGAPQVPTPASKKTKSTGQAPRRQSSRKQSSDDSPAPKKQKLNNDNNGDDSWIPTKQDWEPHIDKIETVERNESGTLMAYILFKNGKKSKVTMEQIHRHCPRPMLRFYEEHLKFSHVQQEQENVESSD